MPRKMRVEYAGTLNDGKPLKRLEFALRLLDTGLKPRC
jgi:hypothetical protein